MLLPSNKERSEETNKIKCYAEQLEWTSAEQNKKREKARFIQ